MSTRPRRQAAAKSAQVIELSDSDDTASYKENDEYQQSGTRSRNIDRAASGL